MASRSDTTRQTGHAGPVSAATPENNSTARSSLRAVPVLFVLLLVAVAALAVSPGLRHELAQSFSRQTEHYVELYFADEDAARTCPLTADGRLRLDATVRSHLAGSVRIGWTATVRADSTATTAGTTAGTASGTASGTAATRPGHTTDITARLPVPATSYTATLQLTGRAERLTVHC